MSYLWRLFFHKLLDIRHGLVALDVRWFMAFHIYYLINLGIQLPILLSHNLDFDLLRRLITTVPAESTYLIQQVTILMGLAGSLTIIYLLGRVNRRTGQSPCSAWYPT